MTSDGRFLMKQGSLPEVPAALLADIVTAASDLALVISADHVVRSALANPHAGFWAKVSQWHGLTLESLLTAESWRKLLGRLEGADLETHRVLVIELTHADAADFEFPVRYAVSRLGDDGGWLMVGRDMRPIAELQQQLVQAQLALERDYEAQRELETRYRVLMEASPSPLLIVSVASGRIVDLNALAADLVGAPRSELLDAPLMQEFEGRRRGELMDNLARLAADDPAGNPDLMVRRNRKKVTVLATAFRAAGDKLLLCRLDLSDSSRAQRGDLAELSERLFQKGIDAKVFLDNDGVVTAANESFLNLTDSGSLAMVQGRSFADFLSRGAIDLRVLLDNVRRVGHLRHYPTRLNTDFSGQVSVEISATLFQDRTHPAIALVIRDSNLADATRILPGPAGNEGLRNVMQMVGYSTLRDIVNETTEIIEKMCIETALELTGNNRVAAAELLSLSRQSLYVKLRKFGLLNKAVD